MKVISKNEFQDAYMSPTEEQTDRMRAKLNSLQQEPEERRQILRAKPRPAFVLAAVLIIVGITAIATSTIRYQITWGGEVKEYDTKERDEEYEDFYSSIPDEMFERQRSATDEGYYVSISGPHKKVSITYPGKLVKSEEDMIAILHTDGYPHPASLIPEGYIFDEGKIEYGILNHDEIHLVDNMTIGDYSLNIYSVEPDNLYIDGYCVAFSNDEKQDSHTWIDVSESPSKDGTMYFYTDTSYNMETLSVPWMEDAFIIRTAESNELHMLKNITENRAFYAGSPSRTEIKYLSILAMGAVDDVINSDWCRFWR